MKRTPLQEEIRFWYAIQEAEDGELPFDAKITSYYRPLCSAYACIDCPVFKHTGKEECSETPYLALQCLQQGEVADLGLFDAYLQEEIKFLEGLEA